MCHNIVNYHLLMGVSQLGHVIGVVFPLGWWRLNISTANDS